MYLKIVVVLLFLSGYNTSWVYKRLNGYFDIDNRVYIQRLGLTLLTLLLCVITFGGTFFVIGFLATKFF